MESKGEKLVENVHPGEHGEPDQKNNWKDDQYLSDYYKNHFGEVNEAIELCKQVIQFKGERFVSGWVVVSINEWNQHQERVIIISSGAYYRVKYDFGHKTVVHSQRITLPTITHIEVGWISNSSSTLETATEQKVDTDNAYYGVRIFANDTAETYRTFRSHYPGQRGKEFIDKLTASLDRIRQRTFAPDSIVKEVDAIRVRNNFPPLASVHNAFKLGMWLKL